MGADRVTDRQRRTVQEPVEVAGSVQPGLGRVETGPHTTQREVALGSEQQHHERGREADAARRQPEADLHRDERDREGRDQLEGECRQERDAQCAHRGRPVLLRHLVDRVALCLRAAEQPQCRQPFDDVEEVTTQSLQHGPLPLCPALGHPSDQHHEDRDEWHGDGDEDGRQPVCGQDASAGREWHGDGEHQRRQELTDVRLEFVDARGGDRRFAVRVTGARAVAVGDGVFQDRRGNRLARCAHRARGGPLGGAGRGGASDGDAGEHEDQADEASGDLAVLHQVRETLGEHLGLDDDRDRRDDSNSGDDRDVSTQRRNEPDQPDVDRPTPADIAHDRWTTGRCWVPIRLRNTQYVHPWYSNTIGVITRATRSSPSRCSRSTRRSPR